MRLILLYILFIGAPVFGITGLLRLGERLTPPASVKGNWVADLSSQANDPSGNSGLITIAVSQSGTHLSIIVQDKKKNVLIGLIQDGMIRATARSDTNPKTNESGDATIIGIDARLNRHDEPEQLRGELTLAGRSEPVQVPFVATRQ